MCLKLGSLKGFGVAIIQSAPELKSAAATSFTYTIGISSFTYVASKLTDQLFAKQIQNICSNINQVLVIIDLGNLLK